jgi:hypothetical protein
LPAAAQTLAVPFLPQTEALCGGAAAAMVMRYWGAADVYPDAFAPLVDRAAGGIRAVDLAGDLRQRGWMVAAGAGTVAEMEKELARGRPVIALIEDRPGRFHYVVVVASAGGRVTLHDPARGPSREVDAPRFDAAWHKSQRWMLLLLPPPPPVPVPGLESSWPLPGTVADRPGTETGERRPGTGCGGLVDEAVRQAETDRAVARGLLGRATVECAEDAAAWREMAGLEALDGNWGAAAAHASEAVARDPADAHAWRTLATARYLLHDDRGALAAWNRVAEPTVHLVDVRGLTHTRYEVAADAIGVPLKTVLTTDALARAERRLRDVPSIAAARVTFRPTERGRAQVDASVVERDRFPWGRAALLRGAFGASTEREIALSFSNLTGGGDLAGAAWRWWEHRPMVSAFYAAPAPRAIGGGTWRLDVSRETQTFGREPFDETRTRAAMTLGNWLTDRTRVSGTAAVERWQGRGDDVAMGGGVEHWRLNGRLRLSADATQAIGPQPFGAGRVTAAARSSTAPAGFVLLGIAGYAAASGASPASVWPGADTGHARDVLLRAHPILDDGIVTGGAFGRRLAFATLEAQRWTAFRRIPARWAPAAFVDVARATRGLPASDERVHVDAGAGLRLSLPGTAVMRIDVAHGLRDGGFVVSAGWDRRIPNR